MFCAKQLLFVVGSQLQEEKQHVLTVRTYIFFIHLLYSFSLNSKSFGAGTMFCHDHALLEMTQFESAHELLESSEFVKLPLKQWHTRTPLGSNLCRTATY